MDIQTNLGRNPKQIHQSDFFLKAPLKVSQMIHKFLWKQCFLMLLRLTSVLFAYHGRERGEGESISQWITSLPLANCTHQK